MRVIGGEFRSRALKSLPGLDVRPTPDPLREALFNVFSDIGENYPFVFNFDYVPHAPANSPPNYLNGVAPVSYRLFGWPT
jgi:hypothetical protein